MGELSVYTDEQTSTASEQLERVAGQFPELTELKSPELSESVDTLISEFGIMPSFFEGANGSANTLILASIAQNLVNLERAGKTPLNDPSAYEYIADATMLVAMNHTSDFKELADSARVEAEGPVSEAAKEALLHRYKSEELTSALTKKIEDEGLLDKVRSRLGVTPENEDPYELLVLSIPSDDLMYGLSPELNWPNGEDFDQMTDAQKAAYHKEHDIVAGDVEASEAWKRGFIDRRKKFITEYGKEFSSPAFVETIGEKKYLCVAADTAELIAYDQDELRTKDYKEDGGAGDDIALLEHEYVHTQGMTTLENQMGIGIEERRAELFSGDKVGYRDIKVFFQDIRLVTGYDITQTLESRVKGGWNDEIYADLAVNLGLDKLVKIVGAYPRNYIREQSSAIIRSADTYMRGYDGVVQELVDSVYADGAEDEMNARLDEYIDPINPESMNSLMSTRRRTSRVGTELVEARRLARLKE